MWLEAQSKGTSGTVLCAPNPNPTTLVDPSPSPKTLASPDPTTLASPDPQPLTLTLTLTRHGAPETRFARGRRHGGRAPLAKVDSSTPLVLL